MRKSVVLLPCLTALAACTPESPFGFRLPDGDPAADAVNNEPPANSTATTAPNPAHCERLDMSPPQFAPAAPATRGGRRYTTSNSLRSRATVNVVSRRR